MAPAPGAAPGSAVRAEALGSAPGPLNRQSERPSLSLSRSLFFIISAFCFISWRTLVHEYYTFIGDL